jgi:polyisoprenoid-binding protein YceI
MPVRFEPASIRSAALALAIGLAASVPVTEAAVADPAHGQVTFSARQTGVVLDGSFQRFSANIDFDPAHPEKAKIEVGIDLASVDAGGADTDNVLKGREFFDVARFPSASFVATSVAADGSGKYRASGRFTLKGHSETIVIPFVARRDGASLWFEGGTTVSRLAYKVGEGQWSDPSDLDDEVRIAFRLQIAG